MVVTCAACSDEEEVMWTPADRSRTLELILSDAPLAVRAVAEEAVTEAATATAAEDNDPEYYIGTVDLKFFVGTDTTATPLYTCQLKREKYRTDTALVRLASDTVAMLFPDGATTCTLYALANAPAADATGDIVSTPLPMDGYATITLDRRHMTMSGSVTLVRRVAKVAVRLLLPASISVEGETYVPAASPAPKAELLYKGQSATAEFAVSASSSDEAESAEAYTTYGHTPFYVYPSSWGSDYTTDVPTVRLAVAWQPAAGGSATTFYYEFPVSYDSTRLLRNYAYVMEVSLNRAGSRVAKALSSVEGVDYEVLPWGTEDTQFSTEWNNSHFLTVSATEFQLSGSQTTVFSYASCVAPTITLTDISYESARYLDSNNKLTTLHLYRTSGSYTTNESTVREEMSDLLSDLTSFATSTPNLSSQQTYLHSGCVTFGAPLAQLAARLYRPVTYTFLLSLPTEHGTHSQTITVTQTPSNYVSYGTGGNVFVNGYYSMMDESVCDGSRSYYYTTGSIFQSEKYYYSYAFTTSNYTSDPGTNYIGYYYSDDATLTIGSLSIPNIFSKGNGDNDDYVTTSYGSLSKDRGSISWTLTTDIYVSAFTAQDCTYALNVVDVDGTSNNETRKYIIGNPRVNGGYTKDQDHSSTYDYSGNFIYDYLTLEKTKRVWGKTYYYRYSQTWDNLAEAIMVGGRTESYNDMIAPQYKIQSDFGLPVGSCYYPMAEKRCATYQEAGYPAGRWRLPTVAELAFEMKLQTSSLIKDHVSTDVDFWTSSGSTVNLSESGTINCKKGYYNRDNEALASVRCVYDLWYWGDSPKSSTTTYYPEPK
jgi:hypothetical protein